MMNVVWGIVSRCGTIFTVGYVVVRPLLPTYAFFSREVDRIYAFFHVREREYMDRFKVSNPF